MIQPMLSNGTDFKGFTLAVGFHFSSSGKIFWLVETYCPAESSIKLSAKCMNVAQQSKALDTNNEIPSSGEYRKTLLGKMDTVWNRKIKKDQEPPIFVNP